MMNLTVFRFIGFVIIATFLAYKGQPLIHGNEKAIDIIINVFAILAGFLISVMMLFNDVDFDEDANWRKIQLREDAQNQKFTKHSILFWTYLLVVFLAFIAILFKDTKYVCWLEYSYLWLACISILYSFLLPSDLRKMRKRKFNKLMGKKLPKSLK